MLIQIQGTVRRQKKQVARMKTPKPRGLGIIGVALATSSNGI